MHIPKFYAPHQNHRPPRDIMNDQSLWSMWRLKHAFRDEEWLVQVCCVISKIWKSSRIYSYPMQLKLQNFTRSQGNHTVSAAMSHDAIASWNFLEQVSRKSFTVYHWPLVKRCRYIRSFAQHASRKYITTNKSLIHQKSAHSSWYHCVPFLCI